MKNQWRGSGVSIIKGLNVSFDKTGMDLFVSGR